MEDLIDYYLLYFDNKIYENYTNIIREIFISNNLRYGFRYDLNDCKILNIIGLYYKNREKNYGEMKKYFLMAINLNDAEAMCNLGDYYLFVEKNIDEMEHYLKMAINLNHIKSMCILAQYYKNIGKYDLMKQYFNMAVKLDSCCAMLSLGHFYQTVEINYEEMKKYYFMTVKFNNETTLNFINVFKIEIQHYLLKNINSNIAIEKIKELEENNFLGVKIFKDLTEYVFNPQRLLRICNIYGIELNDYMDII